MNQIPDTDAQRSLRVVAITSFFSAVVALCIFEILSVDFGWHIKTGELIWATRSIPTRDAFSYIAQGRPWVDSHWLFQVMIYAVHAAAGFSGLCALRILLVVAAFGSLLSIHYRREYLPTSLLVCLLAVFVSYQRFVMRPELVSLCFLALFFYCMENFPKRPRVFIVLLPLCQLLWTNMHGLAVLGVAFLAIYLVGDTIQLFLSKSRSGSSDAKLDARELKLKLVVFGLVVLAYLANANGVEGILYPFRIFSELRGEISAFPRLEELESPFSIEPAIALDPVAVYKLFVVISALAWIGHWRSVRFAHILLYAAFFYLSTLAMRNMSLFAVVATPITVRNLNGILDRVFHAGNLSAKMRGAVALVTAASMLLVSAMIWTITSNNQLYAQLRWPRIFGVGLSDRFAGDVIDELSVVDGRFFNSPDLGGYLIWKLYPQKQVAVDGRWEVYGDLYPELKRAYGDPDVFSRLVDEHDIVAVVLSTRTSLAKKMTRWIRKSRTWHLTERSENVLLFERLDRVKR